MYRLKIHGGEHGSRPNFPEQNDMAIIIIMFCSLSIKFYVFFLLQSIIIMPSSLYTNNYYCLFIHNYSLNVVWGIIRNGY